MTIWSAPDVKYLLDDHLKQARLELLADHRLKLVAEDGGGEEPGFVAELIVDKLEAAAQAGFDAVEASLRAVASQHLGDRGLAVEEVRGALAEACARLVPPKRPQLEKVALGIVPPALVGGMVSAALLVLVFALWTLGKLTGVWYLAAALAAVAAGYAVTRWILAKTARRRAQLIEEWPSRVCRHYAAALAEGTAYYEHVVRTAARRGVLIPWR